MELVTIIKWIIRILGLIPLILVVFLWTQGYVDEFYQARNEAEWINDAFVKYDFLVEIYWAITIPLILFGYYLNFKGMKKGIGKDSSFAIASIVIAIIFYLVVIMNYPETVL